MHSRGNCKADPECWYCTGSSWDGPMRKGASFVIRQHMPWSYLHPELGDELCPWENGPHLQPLSASLNTSCPMTHFMPSQQQGSGCLQQHYETRTQGSSLLHPGHMLPPSLVFSPSIFFLFFSPSFIILHSLKGRKAMGGAGKLSAGRYQRCDSAGWMSALPATAAGCQQEGWLQVCSASILSLALPQASPSNTGAVAGLWGHYRGFPWLDGVQRVPRQLPGL